VSGPIYTLDTSISGTSTAPVGSTITVYKNGVSIGTTTVQAGGTWTLTGVSGLVAGDLITARVSSGGATSAVSNTVTVLATPQILKESSANGSPVSPGDVLTYTIQLYNNTASTWANMVVTDSLPSNTTYVAASSSVSGPKDQTYLDQFTTAGSYTGTNGTITWSGTPWGEIGEADGAGAGNVQVLLDTGFSNALRITGQYFGAYRAANLSNTSSAVLTFTYRRDNTNANCTLTADISNDNGATYPVTLTTIAGGTNDAAYQASGSLTIPAGYLTSAFRLRFYKSGTSTSTARYFYIDNVQIAIRQNLPCTGATLPALVGGASPCTGYSLLAGEKMTATFQVTVNNPLPPGRPPS